MIPALALSMTLAFLPGGAGERTTITQDYREILQMLRHLDDTLDDLGAVVGLDVGGWQPECRGYSPEKTVRCAAETFRTSVDQALAVWRCESGWGVEPGGNTGHVYHGPFQYLYSTYASQQSSMPDIVRWFDLSPAVHDVRSNILTAIAWASRHGWGPWGCA